MKGGSLASVPDVTGCVDDCRRKFFWVLREERALRGKLGGALVVASSCCVASSNHRSPSSSKSGTPIARRSASEGRGEMRMWGSSSDRVSEVPSNVDDLSWVSLSSRGEKAVA